MSDTQRQISFLGSIGAACIAFTWLVMLVPRAIAVLDPVLNRIGPLQWIVPLAMVALPLIAAKRGSKWWLAVAAVGAITFVEFLRHVLG